MLYSLSQEWDILEVDMVDLFSNLFILQGPRMFKAFWHTSAVTFKEFTVVFPASPQSLHTTMCPRSNKHL